jgi:hypothetical protein
MGEEERCRDMVASRDEAEMEWFDIRLIGRVMFSITCVNGGMLS